MAQLVEGLRRSADLPCELIIVDMGSDPPIKPLDATFPVHVIHLDCGGLPLAAARNAAAKAAISERLLFLDVDCIPMRDLVGAISRVLQERDALLCAEARYLGPADARHDWDEEELKLSAARHPVRPFPYAGLQEELNAGLFWSLAFGIRRASFFRLGGFDEAFTGYGAEDTDFGFRAQRAGLSLLFMGGPGVFHQYHHIMDPPLQHLQDIVRNAQHFYDRWSFWPMEGWLAAFEALGLVERITGDIRLLRLPTDIELKNARRLAPV